MAQMAFGKTLLAVVWNMLSTWWSMRNIHGVFLITNVIPWFVEPIFPHIEALGRVEPIFWGRPTCRLAPQKANSVSA